MSIAVFLMLAAIAVAIIAYPMLPGRTPAPPAPALTDGEIDLAVRNLQRARQTGGLACPTCGRLAQQGDLFCVQCGGQLPEVQAKAEPVRLVCSSCGVSLHAGDQFCAKCGHPVGEEEAE